MADPGALSPTGLLAHSELQVINGQVMDTFRDRIYGLSSASDEMPSQVVMKVSFRRASPDSGADASTWPFRRSSTRAWTSGSSDGVPCRESPSPTSCSSTSVRSGRMTDAELRRAELTTWPLVAHRLVQALPQHHPIAHHAAARRRIGRP